jgi:inorganic pyrophosphatase
MNKKMRIEQTPDSEFRTEYDPTTDEFRTTAYRCRSFEYGCEGYYGWLVDTGTPPEPHLDMLLLSDEKYNIGDIVMCKIIGYFRRNDADHKLLGIEPSSTINDISELQPEVLKSLQRLYSGKYEGEAWIGRKGAEQAYLSFVDKK